MPDTQKATAASGSAVQSTAATQKQTQSAIDLVDQMDGFVHGLRKELRSYGEPETVGRDTAKLTELFDQIWSCEMAAASALGINWTPNLTPGFYQGRDAGQT